MQISLSLSPLLCFPFVLLSLSQAIKNNCNVGKDNYALNCPFIPTLGIFNSKKRAEFGHSFLMNLYLRNATFWDNI